MISGVVVLELSVFCFTLTVIFHVQVEVQVEFTYLSVDGVEIAKSECVYCSSYSISIQFEIIVLQ